MPDMPNELRRSNFEHAFRNYANDSTYAALNRQLDKAANFARQRNVPVFCGEFGAPDLANNEDRIRYYQFIVNAFNERNIPWISHDYHHPYGIFNLIYGDDGYPVIELNDINVNLNVELARVMGFTPPPQRPRRIEQLRSNFTIYDDFLGQRITAANWFSESILDLYNSNASEGLHSILWRNFGLWEDFRIFFNRIFDFSFLARNGYRLEFRARTETPVQFVVNFLNPENSSSFPWRMGSTVDNRMLPPDGRWHTISIPLANMREQGGYCNTTRQFLNPRGQFTWNQVNTLLFLSSQEGRNNRLFIDSIRIVAP
jgi:endoglucanase